MSFSVRGRSSSLVSGDHSRIGIPSREKHLLLDYLNTLSQVASRLSHLFTVQLPITLYLRPSFSPFKELHLRNNPPLASLASFPVKPLQQYSCYKATILSFFQPRYTYTLITNAASPHTQSHQWNSSGPHCL